MSLNALISDQYRAFEHYGMDKQVVLLHPQSRLRSMLITYLLSNPPKKMFYYALGPNDVNLNSFLDGFTHDLATQHPVFGRNLFEVWDKNSQLDLPALVDAFCEDLAELYPDNYMLILDEFDSTDEADEVQSFWESVVHQLPNNCQLVINGRVEPRMPWVSMIASGQAIILRDDDIVRENFYRNDTWDNPNINLFTYGFGPGTVERKDGEVGDWEGHLPRLLYFFVLDRPMVTRSEICGTFWPDLSDDQAVNVFHVTKRRLHKALGFDALVHQDGYYQINPEINVVYDVEEFTSSLLKAREAQDPQVKASYWQEAIDWYKGPFLHGHTEDWILQRRQDFLVGYLDAMQSLAHIRLDEGRPEQALALLNRAAGENETYEPIHREIMKLYVDLGRRSEAAGHYQKLAGLLKDHNLKPEAETVHLYEALVKA